MSVDYKLIGSRIKAKRREQKMTQDELSEAMSVTVGYVSQLERGVTKISLDTLAVIAAILGCDLTYFVSGAAEDHDTYLNGDLMSAFGDLSRNERRLALDLIEAIRRNRDNR